MNARGVVKLVGVGQRVVRRAAHVGGVVIIRGAPRIAALLETVYRELDYPLDYVDDLPLDDAPPLPAGVSEGYVPTFERPDLIGDGMLVPLEFEIDGPELDLGEAEAP